MTAILAGNYFERYLTCLYYLLLKL